MTRAEAAGLREAYRQMLAAADLIARARRELRAAHRRLVRRRDYKRIAALERNLHADDYTITYWAAREIAAILQDPIGLDEAIRWLRENGRPGGVGRSLANARLADRESAALGHRFRRAKRAAR